MKQSVLVLVVMFGVCAGVAKDANAQGATWADRGYVNIGFGVESGSSSLTEYGEFGHLRRVSHDHVEHEWTSGSLVDAGFGVRVWRNLTVGIAYHQEENDTDTSADGIDSQSYLLQPSPDAESGSRARAERKGRAPVFGWVVPLDEKFDFMLFGGPSFFRLEQDVVSDVEIGEARRRRSPKSWPMSTVTTQKKSLTGYNVGVDGTYILWSNDDIRVGAGGFVRFTQATGDIQMMTTDTSH